MSNNNSNDTVDFNFSVRSEFYAQYEHSSSEKLKIFYKKTGICRYLYHEDSLFCDNFTNILHLNAKKELYMIRCHMRPL